MSEAGTPAQHRNGRYLCLRLRWRDCLSGAGLLAVRISSDGARNHAINMPPPTRRLFAVEIEISKHLPAIPISKSISDIGVKCNLRPAVDYFMKMVKRSIPRHRHTAVAGLAVLSIAAIL